MAVSRADLDQVMSFEGKVPDDPSLAVLREECIGCAIAEARAEEWETSEPDIAELIVRGAGLTPDRVRKVESTLRRLGYRLVADRLRHIAGRRRHDLAPLSS
jgi:hypothetical protein